ncbi:unnamed protein product [Mesocestoides corti]|uniref:Uncharacterized protein n=1 Tax=Mesocestoides corti TaxID=53468 RepID=A0A0R3UME1_MESCO|nr:unnamed protein product [Mesocestoides corti]
MVPVRQKRNSQSSAVVRGIDENTTSPGVVPRDWQNAFPELELRLEAVLVSCGVSADLHAEVLEGAFPPTGSMHKFDEIELVVLLSRSASHALPISARAYLRLACTRVDEQRERSARVMQRGGGDGGGGRRGLAFNAPLFYLIPSPSLQLCLSLSSLL